MSKQRAIGTAVESAIVRYARAHGFPHADRRPLAGALDKGDVLLCPGVIVEAKGGKAAEHASDGQIAAWLAETEAERVNANAAIGVLVTKRKGVGVTRAGDFWAHLDAQVFSDLLYEPDDGDEFTRRLNVPVRARFGDVLWLLRYAGWGEDIDD